MSKTESTKGDKEQSQTNRALQRKGEARKAVEYRAVEGMAARNAGIK